MLVIDGFDQLGAVDLAQSAEFGRVQRPDENLVQLAPSSAWGCGPAAIGGAFESGRI